jgi:hypothetical protein
MRHDEGVRRVLVVASLVAAAVVAVAVPEGA